jgi:hypothetical protein
LFKPQFSLCQAMPELNPGPGFLAAQLDGFVHAPKSSRVMLEVNVEALPAAQTVRRQNAGVIEQKLAKDRKGGDL